MSKTQTAPKAAPTAAEQPLPMKIDVKIGSIRPDGNVRAYASEYKDICFPVTKEFREQLNQAVVDAYQQALTQSQTQGRQLMEQASQPEQQPGMQMAGL